MNKNIIALFAGLAVVGLTGTANANEAANEGQRNTVREAPIKDCTRLNGRFGYYGNPWCTPEEQARWDKWSAKQGMLR